MKLKTLKSVSSRIKITKKGKLLRRHQLAAGHLKRKKSKGALNQSKRVTTFFKGDVRRLRKALGL